MLISFSNVLLFSVTTSVSTSPMSERTCSSWVFVMTSTGVVVVAGLHSDVRSGAGVLAMAFFSLFQRVSLSDV